MKEARIVFYAQMSHYASYTTVSSISTGAQDSLYYQ